MLRSIYGEEGKEQLPLRGGSPPLLPPTSMLLAPAQLPDPLAFFKGRLSFPQRPLSQRQADIPMRGHFTVMFLTPH